MTIISNMALVYIPTNKSSSIEKHSFSRRTLFIYSHWAASTQHKMCHITHQIFKDCPCRKTSTKPCDTYIAAIDEFESGHHRHLHFHRSASRRHHLLGDGEDTGKKKAKPEIKDCPLFHEEDAENPDKIEGTCEMVPWGCLYNDRQTSGEAKRVWESPEEMWVLNLRGKDGVW
jgi:hypothetical protein